MKTPDTFRKVDASVQVERSNIRISPEYRFRTSYELTLDIFFVANLDIFREIKMLVPVKAIKLKFVRTIGIII